MTTPPLKPTKKSGAQEPMRTGLAKSAGTETTADRLKAETAAESMVENHLSPAVSEEEAIKAAVRKK